MIERTEAAILAERLMRTRVAGELRGMYRIPEGYVGSIKVACTLVEAVGIKKSIEVLVQELERQSRGDKNL